MAKQTINVGSGEYSGDGESIRIAFTKVNSNFTEIYTQAPLATTATYAQSFNTSTLVRAAVSATTSLFATTSSFATTSGYALSFNTGTIVGTAVSATNVVNGTWTLALSTSGSILLNGTVFSGGAVSATTSTLVNGARTLSLGSDGTVTLPNFDIMAGIGSKIKSALDIKIQAGAYYLSNLSILYSDFFTIVFSISSAPDWATVVAVGDYVISGTCVRQITAVTAPDAGEWRVNVDIDDFTGAGNPSSWSFYKPGATNSIWTFGKDGSLTFPNATVQTTAYTGLTPNGTKASTATGTAGQTSYDSTYFYICIATNTWRRVALGSTY